MERELVIGMHVVFIDEHRRERDALLTAIHGDIKGRLVLLSRKDASELTEEERNSGKWRFDQHNPPIYAYELDEQGKEIEEYLEPGKHWPCVNLVVVSENAAAKDQYGRQIDERHSSIVHHSDSSAIGYCYRFAGEEIDWSKMQKTIS